MLFRSLRTALVALTLLLGPVGLANAQKAEGGDKPAAAAATAPTVNVNTATVEQLVALPGVGPAKAQAIVDMRKQLGGYKKLDDLLRVKGIGRKTLRQIEPMLKL